MVNIVNAGMALAAMRHAPYTTPSALAELIDNSIQAKAENITLIAKDEIQEVGKKAVSRLTQLAIYDDGHGMNAETIESALSVGFSRNKDDPNGIGKFGFGMTVGSISQCYRVEVYSWQKNGPILFTYIDLDELLDSGDQDLPAVSEVKEVPLIKKHSHAEGLIKRDSGTLVILKKLDPTKVKYKTSKGIFNYLKMELGRIYRHFLDDDDNYGRKRNIRVVSMIEDGSIIESDDLIANDPLYLLTPNSLPPVDGVQYKNEATNILLEDNVIEVPIEYTNEYAETNTSIVEIRATVAKPQIRSGLTGSSPVGKHYSQNQGVSFVRAAREIELREAGWVNSYSPTERWWGISIRFEPCLDDIFGTTNDKQKVQNIFHLSNSTPKEYYENADDDEAITANIKINNELSVLIKKLRDIIKANPVARGGKKKGDLTSTEDKVNKEITKDTTPTKSKEIAKTKTREEKIEEFAKELLLKDETLNDEEAKARAEEVIDRIVDFNLKDWPGSMFLERQNIANGVHANINIRSDFYKHFYEYLENMDDGKPVEAMKILLMAFVRTEDEMCLQYDPDDEIFEKFRERWGYWIQQLMKISNDV